MKKTLVAIAALAAVGSVFAQSSVTLYGRLNMGSSGNTADTYNAAGTKTGEVKTTSLAGAEGINTTQRFGVRGSEDIGGGLKVNFNVETKVFSDSNAATFGNTRNALVQVAGGFGSVTIGTYLNALDGNGAYAAGAFSVAGGDILARVAGVTGLSSRSTNSVAYRSPNLSGLSLFIGTSNENTDRTNAAGVKTTTELSGYMLGADYANGPLEAKIVYGRGTGQNPAAAAVPAVPGNAGTAAVTANNADVSDWGITAKYEMGFIAPYAAYRSSKTDGTVGGVAGVDSTGKVFEVGAKFPLGALTPYITYARGDNETSVAGVLATDTTLSGWQIGAYYDLSKRTYLMASFGYDRTESNLAGSRAGTKNRGYGLGIIHNF